MKRETFALLILWMIFCGALCCYGCEGSVAPQYRSLTRPNQLRCNEYELICKPKERTLQEMKEARLKSFGIAGKGASGSTEAARPHTSTTNTNTKQRKKNGAQSTLLKSSSLLSATFGHVVLGSLVFVFFY